MKVNSAMTSYNDITGDALTSKSNTENFRDNYDRIFKSKAVTKPTKPKKEVKKG